MERSSRTSLAQLGLDVLILLLAVCVTAGTSLAVYIVFDLIASGRDGSWEGLLLSPHLELWILGSVLVGLLAGGFVLGAYARRPWLLGTMLPVAFVAAVLPFALPVVRHPDFIGLQPVTWVAGLATIPFAGLAGVALARRRDRTAVQK